MALDELAQLYEALIERAAMWLRSGRSAQWLLDADEVAEAEAILADLPDGSSDPDGTVHEFVRQSRGAIPVVEPLPAGSAAPGAAANPARGRQAAALRYSAVPNDRREASYSAIDLGVGRGGAGSSSMRPVAPPSPPPLPSVAPVRLSDLISMRTGGMFSFLAGRPKPVEADAVDVSVFAPARAKPQSGIMVQVLLHHGDDLDDATARATAVDETARLRGTATLDILVLRGARAIVMLTDPGLEIAQPVLPIVWRGKTGVANFVARIRAESNVDLFPAVVVTIDGAPVGEIRFKLSVRKNVAEAERNSRMAPAPKRYSRVFFSYSSADRGKVLEISQAYRLAGIDFFQDILSLEPGQRWENGLYQEIDRCDLFLLFWSQNASASDWVAKEARYALERRSRSGDRTPDVVPLVLEGPPAPTPPEFLQHLHFDDWMRLAIAAQASTSA